MTRIDRTFPWLVFPAAVDLANTVVVSSGEIDLLTTEEELATWAAAESGRIPGVESVGGALAQVRRLRDAVRAVLFRVAEGGAPPPEGVAVLNAASATALSYPVLSEEGVVEEVLVGDAFSRFQSAVARSAIDLVTGPDRASLEVCRAPSCGMFFLRRGATQRWCSERCGNRTRVARHARRRRTRGSGPP